MINRSGAVGAQAEADRTINSGVRMRSPTRAGGASPLPLREDRAAKRIDGEGGRPNDAPWRQPRPVSPQTDAKIHPMGRFAHMPDDDLIKALITALKPASVTPDDQPAEVAEA